MLFLLPPLLIDLYLQRFISSLFHFCETSSMSYIALRNGIPNEFMFTKCILSYAAICWNTMLLSQRNWTTLNYITCFLNGNILDENLSEKKNTHILCFHNWELKRATTHFQNNTLSCKQPADSFSLSFSQHSLTSSLWQELQRIHIFIHEQLMVFV